MRIFWEEDDIRGGIHVIRESSPVDDPCLSFASSVAYMIGFDAGTDAKTMISVCDGMTLHYDSKQELADHLNNDDFGFRPLEGEALIEVLRYANGCHPENVGGSSKQRDSVFEMLNTLYHNVCDLQKEIKK